MHQQMGVVVPTSMGAYCTIMASPHIFTTTDSCRLCHRLSHVQCRLQMHHVRWWVPIIIPEGAPWQHQVWQQQRTVATRRGPSEICGQRTTTVPLSTASGEESNNGVIRRRREQVGCDFSRGGESGNWGRRDLAEMIRMSVIGRRGSCKGI